MPAPIIEKVYKITVKAVDSYEVKGKRPSTTKSFSITARNRKETGYKFDPNNFTKVRSGGPEVELKVSVDSID